jgi:hypothetical protein
MTDSHVVDRFKVARIVELPNQLILNTILKVSKQYARTMAHCVLGGLVQMSRASRLLIVMLETHS